jgi:uncharacterized protein (DUF433 family)
MDWKDRIAIDPNVLVGKPTVRGTRLAVQFIVDLLAQGWTERDLLDNYPGLTAIGVNRRTSGGGAASLQVALGASSLFAS